MQRSNIFSKKYLLPLFTWLLLLPITILILSETPSVQAQIKPGETPFPKAPPTTPPSLSPSPAKKDEPQRSGTNPNYFSNSLQVINGYPLTIYIGGDGNYQLKNALDPVSASGGQFYHPNSIPANATIAMWVNGYVYQGRYGDFYPVGQNPVTGSGTSTDPFRQVTLLDVPNTSIRIRQTTEYVNGELRFRHYWSFENNLSGLPSPSFTFFFAADLYFQGNDYGYGYYDNATGAIGGYNQNNTSYIMFIPISSADRYFEGYYSDVWNRIGYNYSYPGAGFNNTILTSYYHDDGIGLQWNNRQLGTLLTADVQLGAGSLTMNGVPKFDSWEADDLFTKGLQISSSIISTTWQFDIKRFYGPVNSDHTLIQASGTLPRQNNATILLWTDGGTYDTIKINGIERNATLLGSPGPGSLIGLSFPNSFFEFPDGCLKPDGSTRNPCLRDHNVPNYSTVSGDSEPFDENTAQLEKTFGDIQARTNKISIEVKSGHQLLSIKKAYFFMNAARPVLLMAGIDAPIEGCFINCEKDTTTTWGSTLKNPANDLGNYQTNNWINWLSSRGIPNWNPPRAGAYSIDSQQKFVREGAEFLMKKYGVKKINIIAHSMGGVVTRQFTYDHNIDTQNLLDYSGTSERVANLTVDKLIALDSPQTGVILSGMVGSDGAKDLGTVQLKDRNDKIKGLIDGWKERGPGEQSTNHIFFTNVTGQYYECYLKVEIWPPSALECKISNMQDDSLIEHKSGLGIGYPNKTDQENTNDDGLPGKFATKYSNEPYTSPNLTTSLPLCPHLQTWANDRDCHGWTTHSVENMNWLDQYAGIFTYTKNQVPDLIRGLTGVTLTKVSLQPQSAIPMVVSPWIVEQTMLSISQTLTTGTPVTLPFVIDSGAQDIKISVASSVAGSVVYTLTDSTNAILLSNLPITATLNFSGTLMPAGNYKLVIARIGQNNTDFTAQVTGNSSLALSVTADPPIYGTVVTGNLAANLKNIQTGQTVTGATVTAEMLVTSNDHSYTYTVPITFRDDGTGADNVAGDGVYKAPFPANLYNQYIELDVTASGQFNGLPFTRQTTQYTQVNSGEMLFTMNYNWQTYNKGTWGVFNDVEQLVFQAEVNNTVQGNYLIEATLAAADGTILGSSSRQLLLSTGYSWINFNFSGKSIYEQGKPGPFKIVNLRASYLETNGSHQVTYLTDANGLSTYSISLNQFYRTPFVLAAPATFALTGVDGQGKITGLQANVYLNVAKSDVYTYSAVLRSNNGVVVGAVRGTANLNSGNNVLLIINFYGSTINLSGQDGPYFLESFTLKNITSGEVLFFSANAGQTNSYTTSQFTASCNPLIINDNGDSYTIEDVDNNTTCTFTLRRALEYAWLIGNGQVVFGNNNPITISAPLTLPIGSKLISDCSNRQTVIVTASGKLQLSSYNNLQGLNILLQGSPAVQFGPGSNKLNCTKITRQ